ncbi:hypothetical protein D030_1341B, partial [Vibrio parahaemolyticus AQ3810]
WDGYDS